MSSIKCGHCKSYHPTVAEVRQCAHTTRAGAPPVALWGWNGHAQELKGFAPAEQLGSVTTTPPLHLGSVPEGRYALRRDGKVHFYKVEFGKGKWVGRTFVSEQASDDWFSVRNHGQRDLIKAEIMADLDGARKLYAEELGRCYRCGRTLTDELSRELGIGPDCRNK